MSDNGKYPLNVDELHSNLGMIDRDEIHETCKVDGAFDVLERLNDLKRWEREWREEDNKLLEMARGLDDTNPAQLELGVQIGNLRKRIKMQLVKKPLEVVEKAIRDIGFNVLRENMVRQFVGLTPEQRKDWLINFFFLITPDLRDLNKKFANVRAFRSLGQDRNFLLSGHSGMGKTAYLNWLASNYIPKVQETHNQVVIVKVDAPVNNTSPKPLFKRILLECGKNYLTADTEETLLNKIVLAFMVCGVEVMIVDEVEHIRISNIRRRLLEISNLTEGVGIICASVNARNWTLGDSEVQGRWNDGFRLRRYTGKRLEKLLTMIELLLPFSQPSHLNKSEIRTGPKKSDVIDGPAKIIENYTNGILRDIMILIMDSAIKAIDQNEPFISASILEASWKDIQTDCNRDYVDLLIEAKG